MTTQDSKRPTTPRSEALPLEDQPLDPHWTDWLVPDEEEEPTPEPGDFDLEEYPDDDPAW